MKPTKKLISLIRTLVKPEYQERVLDECSHCMMSTCFQDTVVTVDKQFTYHGFRVCITVNVDDFIDEYDSLSWNDYPKFKPRVEGFYYIRFDGKAEYLRRWMNGAWYDLTGNRPSQVFNDSLIEFKFYKKEL